MEVCGDVLRQMMNTSTAYDLQDNPVPVGGVIRDESVLSLQRLIVDNAPRHCLEVGMGMGMSTLAILYALQKIGGGRHVAIDPNQLSSRPDGFKGVGLSMVKRAGLSDGFEFVEEPSYLTLPRFVAEERRFGLILIDGYHTFDYAFVDYFYSDLLLNEGGILVFDDVSLPMIHKVCWFIETHKDYERLGPQMTHPLNPIFRLRRRLGPRGSRGGDKYWGGFQVYRKRRTTTVPPLFFHTDFYPYFRLWWTWRRLRGFYETITKRSGPPRTRRPY